MASLTRYTWVWVNSRSWWWIGRLGMLRFMGSQRVGHDQATELYWYISYLIYLLMNTSCFHILAVINNAAIGVHVYFLICDFVFFRSIPRSESEFIQLCLTLSDPMDHSLPGPSGHGIFQARVLQWGATASSGVTWTDRKSKKLIILKCLFILGNTNEPFIDQISDVQRKVDFIQLVMTISVAGPRRSSKTSVQFSSVTQSCPILCNPMNRNTPGLPIHHQLLEFTQTHVHRVGDAIQPSHPLLSPSPPALNLFQCQGLFQWVNSSHQVAKVLEFQLHHQSFQWIPRTDLL